MIFLGGAVFDGCLFPAAKSSTAAKFIFRTAARKTKFLRRFAALLSFDGCFFSAAAASRSGWERRKPNRYPDFVLGTRSCADGTVFSIPSHSGLRQHITVIPWPRPWNLSQNQFHRAVVGAVDFVVDVGGEDPIL